MTFFLCLLDSRKEALVVKMGKPNLSDLISHTLQFDGHVSGVWLVVFKSINVDSACGLCKSAKCAFRFS